MSVDVPAELARVLRDQAGVVCRRQVLAAGLAPHDMARLVRRRELIRVHPRVYVDHTGGLSWLQRAWAAVLYAEPAALCLDSAVRLGEGPGRRSRSDDDPIQVAIEPGRRLEAPDGIVLHRTRGFPARVLDLGPPRIRYDEAVLDTAAAAVTDLDALARLADACSARRTTGQRLLDCARARRWLPRRDVIEAVLEDVATGSCSALEQAFLARVVRAHGLPEGVRQACRRHPGNTRFRDVALAELGLVLELDGRLFHDSMQQRDRDMDRDLDAALDGELTIRLSWGQAVDRPCATAVKLADVMRSRGWSGRPSSCAGCAVAA